MKAIVAVDKNWGIGRDNDLLFHYKEDMQVFKNLTLGKPVIMGRKTFESLPNGPLPYRQNIILTRDEKYHPNDTTVIHSLSQLFEFIKDMVEKTSYTMDDICIIGGGQIYETLLPYCAEVYVSKHSQEFQADTFFNNLDSNDNWKCNRIQVSETCPLIYYRYANKSVLPM